MSNEGILIICAKPGFRRNGMAHEARKVWPEDHWSDEELEVFASDPMFTVLSAADVEEVTGDDFVSEKPVELASLEADHPERMAALDEAIESLEAADYGTEGQPQIKVLKGLLGFVPMPDEVTDAVIRHNPDGQPGDHGMRLRAQEIAAVIKSLKGSDLTQAGTPKVAALEKLTGFKPTSGEIETAIKG